MYQIVDSGDESVTVYLADTAGEATLGRVMRFVQLARTELGPWIVDLVPSYCSVAVYYDLLQCDYFQVHAALRRVAAVLDASMADRQVERGSRPSPNASSLSEMRTVELPVYYGDGAAPDLSRIAERAQLTRNEVIALHSGQTYRVYALGFRPGFAFMGETPAMLRQPRLETPRKHVAAGSVAIAGAQAAVYPCASPGGWNLIGRCPTALFHCDGEKPNVVLRVGDSIRFTPIGREKFIELGGVLDD